tara:strand:- start:4446 stop:5402 length:957 start_codon:yes stop_codon:yes gene_type:complete
MTLINLETNSSEDCLHLGDLTTYITDDGSLSLKNAKYEESFHSPDGALKEAQEKFLRPAEINRFKKQKQIFILDVCFGLGYNSACLLEELLKTPIELTWWGLEIDDRPLKIALMNPLYKSTWSKKVLEILNSIQCTNQFVYPEANGKILWGDARKRLKDIPENLKFDLILHDAFSPNKCPQLWSEEFLYDLSRKLALNGRIITYSSSAAIRGSLRRSGLQINSIKPNERTKQIWSSGTLAIHTKNFCQEKNNSPSPNWHPLSKMEEEHLLTVAAVPYRDPSRGGHPQEILKCREREQDKSNLTNSNSWRKRWEKAQSR